MNGKKLNAKNKRHDPTLIAWLSYHLTMLLVIFSMLNWGEVNATEENETTEKKHLSISTVTQILNGSRLFLYSGNFDSCHCSSFSLSLSICYGEFTLVIAHINRYMFTITIFFNTLLMKPSIFEFFEEFFVVVHSWWYSIRSYLFSLQIYRRRANPWAKVVVNSWLYWASSQSDRISFTLW